ncbi:fumarylacetoacetate hydrolase family protein [Parasphingorhabdus pacifica]
MKLVRVGEPGFERPGVLDGDDRIRDLSAFATDVDGALVADTDRLNAVRAALETGELPVLEGVRRFGPPVARPGKVVGIGLNYHDHADEAGVDPPAEPIVFFKPSSSIIGPSDLIVVPEDSEHTDWEVELGVVIGSPLRACGDPDLATRAVAGYATANDLTERAHLQQGPTWARGKCHDTFCPLGPWLVTADEVADPQVLQLDLWVNGTRRQRGSSSDMVFGVGEVLAHLSGLMTLEPGDLVLTGTPGGVAALHPEPRPFLRARDVVEAEVQGLGRQRTAVVRATGTLASG